MRTQTAKRMLLSILGLVVVLGLIAFASRRPSLSVTILHPNFRLLTAKLSHGRSHKLYHNGPVAGPVSELIHWAGLNFGRAPLMGFTTNVTDALVVRFTGDFPPNALAGVQAEVVSDSGATNRLWCIAGYNAGATPSQYGKIWVLDGPLTNGVTIQLVSATGESAFARIRVQAN